MLNHFIDWLNTLLFLVIITLILLFIGIFIFHLDLRFFECFGIAVFIINIIGIVSQMINMSKDEIE
jgi:hypothetical protein